MDNLLSYISRFGRLTIDDKDLVIASFEEAFIPKGHYFVEAGLICSSLGFVKEGIFRSCYYNKHGEDFTRYFTYEGRFIGDINGFIDQYPSTEFIEAITDATILTIKRDDFTTLEKNISAWSSIVARLNATVLENKMKAASNMLTQDGQTRYLHFLEHYPGLVNRIPQAMLASYLGLIPSSLSRIRRNIG